MEQTTSTSGVLKKCCRCHHLYEPSMFRLDPQKKDGRYPSCRVCSSKNGWGNLIKVIARVPCEGCGVPFTPRHNKGERVRHCSRGCAAEQGAWSAEKSGTWRGNSVGYSAAHGRVRRQRGAADTHRCIECGADAAQWSVNREAPQLKTARGMPYSPDPMDYEARCVSCHKLYDLAALTA